MILLNIIAGIIVFAVLGIFIAIFICGFPYIVGYALIGGIGYGIMWLIERLIC